MSPKSNNPKRLRIATAVMTLATLAACAAIAACGSTTTRYYTLAENAQPATAQRSTADTAALAIELAPVALPERFARPQLVVRSTSVLPLKEAASQTELEILEQSRWSSSFEYELRDALASGVATRLSAFDATKAGRPLGLPLYRIAVQLRQFDAQPGTRVDTAFGWSVRRADGDVLVTCQLQLNEVVSGGSDGVAAGAQRITGRLADEIARNVSALAANQPARCPVA